MRTMSRNLVEEILSDVFTIAYCAVKDSIEDSSFSFVQGVVTERIYGGNLDKTLSQTFN